MAEPVSLALAKQQLRIFDSSEHELIEGYIRAAREWVEDHTGHVLVQREFVEQRDAWGDYLILYRQPVVTVDTIAYDSADDDQAAYTGFEYSFGQTPLNIYPATSFPTLRANGFITITYTAGYAEGEVPDRFIDAILVLVAGKHVNRSGSNAEAERAAKSILKDIRKPVMA